MSQRGRLWAMVLLGLTACGPGGDATVSWIRRGDSASFRLPAQAVWCRDLGWLELVAARNDTGIGLVVFPEDSVYLGRYPVVSVSGRHDSIRPVGSMAVRWFSTTELLTFEAYAGEVVLEGAERRLQGHFTGQLAVLVGGDSLRLEGSFRDVPVTWGGIECQVDSVPAAAGVPEVLD